MRSASSSEAGITLEDTAAERSGGAAGRRARWSKRGNPASQLMRYGCASVDFGGGCVLCACLNAGLAFGTQVYRGIAQSGSAPALGAGCREFESLYPDQLSTPQLKKELVCPLSPLLSPFNGGRSSPGRAPDCDSGGSGFETRRPPHFSTSSINPDRVHPLWRFLRERVSR